MSIEHDFVANAYIVGAEAARRGAPRFCDIFPDTDVGLRAIDAWYSGYDNALESKGE